MLSDDAEESARSLAVVAEKNATAIGTEILEAAGNKGMENLRKAGAALNASVINAIKLGLELKPLLCIARSCVGSGKSLLFIVWRSCGASADLRRGECIYCFCYDTFGIACYMPAMIKLAV